MCHCSIFGVDHPFFSCGTSSYSEYHGHIEVFHLLKQDMHTMTAHSLVMRTSKIFLLISMRFYSGVQKISTTCFFSNTYEVQFSLVKSDPKCKPGTLNPRLVQTAALYVYMCSSSCFRAISRRQEPCKLRATNTVKSRIKAGLISI